MTLIIHPKGKFKSLMEDLLLSEKGREKSEIIEIIMVNVNNNQNTPSSVIEFDVFEYKIILQFKESK